MTVRWLPFVVGVLAFAVGVAVLTGTTTVGFGWNPLLLLAVLASTVALAALVRSYGVTERGRTPDPERRTWVPVPGSSLTDAVDEFRTPGKRHYSRANRIREGLYGAAVAVLTRFEGDTEERATERLEAGTWTADPYAAAFLSSSLESPTKSLGGRVSAALGRDRSFREAVSRTVAAVTAVGTAETAPRRDDDGETAGPDRVRGAPLPAYDDEPRERPTLRTGSDRVEGIVERARRSTNHWAGIGLVALAAVAVGAVVESAAVVMAGVVAFGYAGLATALEPPVPGVSLERTLEPASPEPGEEVSVTVRLTNESGRLLPDVRVIDGVPVGLAVTDGVARLGTALRPEESVTFSYTVTVSRGTHEFDPVLLITRDLVRSREREFLLECETELVCEPVMRPLATPVPLRSTAATYTGRLTTTEGGSGTQFHSVREYRRNDPLNRIDWNRRARTGDLATLEFHEERAARVLVLVDARHANYVAPEPDAAHAVDRAVEVAGRIAATLLDDGDAVGLAAIGPVHGRGEAGDGPDACWLAPGSGHHHRVRFRRLLATHPQFSTRPPSETTLWTVQLERIHRRLSREAQVVVLTPLCDRGSVHVVRWLEARGRAVTVLSPDPTADRTAGQQLARLARRTRRFDLQRAGVPVLDWPHEASVDEALARVDARLATDSLAGGGASR